MRLKVSVFFKLVAEVSRGAHDIGCLMVFVVDNIMIASYDMNFLTQYIECFKSRYYITDMGQPKHKLGIHLYYDQDRGIIRLSSGP